MKNNKTLKEIQRAEIKKLTKEFIKKGGKIYVDPDYETKQRIRRIKICLNYEKLRTQINKKIKTKKFSKELIQKLINFREYALNYNLFNIEKELSNYINIMQVHLKKAEEKLKLINYNAS